MRHKFNKINDFIPNKAINIYISYVLIPWFRNLNTDFRRDNYLVGSVKLTKNSDLDKYKYSCYGIAFDLRSKSSLPDGNMGRNAINFQGDMSSSVHIKNKGKDTYFLRTNTRIR